MRTLTKFSPNNMTARNAPSPYTADAETSLVGEGYRLFDSDLNDGSDVGNPNFWVGYPGYVVYYNGAEKVLYSYSIVAHDRPTQMMMDWTVSGSNDNINYTVIDTVSGETGWADGETRSYTCDSTTTGYKYFRFDITASTGGVFVGAKEIYFYEMVETNEIQFVSAYNTCTVRTPDFGYSVECHMPIHIAERHPNGYMSFDADSTGALDYRVLSMSTWLLTESEKYALNEFFKQADIGRCENVIMRLGSTSTGFFPFGPDLGDVGDFTVRLLEQKQGGATYSPKTYFRDELKFVMVSAPGGYSLPTELSEGSFQIGSISGLMPPQVETNPSTNLNYFSMISRTGSPNAMDGRTNSDGYETAIEQWCNESKAAALANHLILNVRDNDVDIIAGDNYYLFGMDNGSNGVYTCMFLGSNKTKNEVILSMKHERYNRWIFQLNFWLKSVALGGGILETTDEGIYEDSTDGMVIA